jgi:antitoxin component HigA of HigAB toxin-antitoxin module
MMTVRTMESTAVRGALPMPRPIRTERQLEKATQLAFRLSEAAESRRLNRDESDYLEVLLLLIERYEESRHSIRGLKVPLDRLKALVENAGLSASDLGRMLGNRALGGKLLSGERELSKAHIRRLADHFRVEPGFFL